MKAGGDKGEENIIRVLREESIQLQRAFKDDTGRIMSQIKEDMHLQQKELRESLAASFSEFRVTFDKNNELVNKIINAKFESLEKFQNERLKELDKKPEGEPGTAR